MSEAALSLLAHAQQALFEGVVQPLVFAAGHGALPQLIGVPPGAVHRRGFGTANY